MSDTFGFDSELIGDAPEVSLALLAGRLHVANASRRVARGFARQESPNTLRSLIAVADEVGLRAKAFRGDVEALTKSALPVIVHLRSPAPDHVAGFAALTECSADGVLLEVGSRNSKHRLSLEQFAKIWTGIVVTLTTNGTTTSAAGRVRRNARCGWDWFSAARAPARAATRARHIGLGLLALAAVGGVVRVGLSGQRAGDAALLLGWVLFTAIGGLASVGLLSRRPTTGFHSGPRRFIDRVCGGADSTIDCDGVLASRWAAPFGLELSALGTAFFAAVLFVMALASVLPADSQTAAYRWLAFAHVAALPGAAFLVAVQIYSLRRVCPLCVSAHVSLFAGAVFSLGPTLPGWRLSTLTTRDALLGALVFALPFALALLFTLGVVAPFVRHDQEREEMATRLDRIGQSVWAVLAEFVGQSSLAVSPPESPFILGDRKARFRLDVLVDPDCAPCGPYLERLGLLVERRPQTVYVAVHLPTHDPQDPGARNLRVALTAAASIDAFRIAKQRLRELLRVAASGAEALLAELGCPANPAALAVARTAQSAADALSVATGDTTPTLVLNGRVWRGSFEDLEGLMVQHPDVLVPNAASSARPPSDAAPTRRAQQPEAKAIVEMADGA